ncbi:hypothetical protein [Fredinandcohnia quinoae]|uniref:Uncharacterized protein n=1 Tax=Fredinandcohnia quinoae TaxID=2918902 RepID=A0AAW5EBP6_9BACI|nr:hypothetical protein [Fredinandcohnia sp. SECRCQ15]MCH1627471.1 hypothetical protein [Fredinandcohnia sp. SECRCQ15]
MQLIQTGIKIVASELYLDLKNYKEAREAASCSSGSLLDGIKEFEEEMKKKMQETPATETLTGIELHERIIIEKAEMLADLGILQEVFNEVEDLDD